MVTILIDPGHPSSSGDTGCTAPGLVEKDYTLEMGLALRDRILGKSWHVGVGMTRWKDEVVTLAARRAIADTMKPSLSLSLHVDANWDNRVCGIQAYRQVGDYLGGAVGKVITDNYPREGYYVRENERRRRKSRVVIAQPHPHWTHRAYNVTKLFAPRPSLLVEMFFSTHPEEREWALSDEGKETICSALFKGVEYAVQEVERGGT